MLTRFLFPIITILSLVWPASGPSSAVRNRVEPAALPESEQVEFSVEFFPGSPHYVGDVLSARITYTGEGDMGGQEIQIALADEPEQVLDTASFSRFTNQAIFYWFLNTENFRPGHLRFTLEIPETNEKWGTGLNLLPNPDWREGAWDSVHTLCCTLHYITGTDSANDLLKLQQIVDERSAEALAQFFPDDPPDVSFFEEPLGVVLVPIVVGHGGFARDEAVMTYTERNWAGIDFEILVHHEIVHVIDRRVNTEGPRPSLLVEGIAVYYSGGHYRQGDPMLRAAALLEMDMYLPLTEITDDFYAAQHEIGYMQAAALVAYLEGILGREGYLDFYFNLPEGESPTAIISAGLEAYLGMDLAAVETEFITYLETLEPDDGIKDDVRLTVAVYDMLRRYQTIVFPSAHFRTAWWPPIEPMREAGIVGDYAFREKSPFDIIIENLFLEIHTSFETGDYLLIENNLAIIDDYLTTIETGNRPFSHYAIGWPLPKLPALPPHPGR